MYKIKILKGLDTVKYWLSAESSGTESAENWLCIHIVAEKKDVEIKYIKKCWLFKMKAYYYQLHD